MSLTVGLSLVRRRSFLRGGFGALGALAGVSLLAACGGTAPAAAVPAQAVAATTLSTSVQTASIPSSSASLASSTAAAAAGKVVGITVLHRGDQNEHDELNQAVALFNKDFAGTYQATGDFATGDYNAKLLTLKAANTLPDVFYMNAEVLSSFAVKDFFYDLGPISARDDATKQYWPQLLELSKYEGKLHGLPKDYSPYVVYVNLDRFKDAGVPLPKPDWTWNDFVQTATALTQRSSGGAQSDHYGAHLLDAGWIDWVWQNGGDIFDSTYSKVLFGETAAVDALQYVADLMNKSRVALGPDALTSSHQTAAQWFQSGGVAMYFMGRWAVPNLRKLTGVNWDSVPLPQGKKAANIFLQSGPTVAATTKEAQASWEFCKTWTGPVGQPINIDTGIAIPSVNSAAIHQDFLAKTPPSTQGNQTFYDAIPIGHPLPSHGGMDWGVISQAIGSSLSDVWTGKISANDAVTKIVPNLQYQLTKYA